MPKILSEYQRFNPHELLSIEWYIKMNLPYPQQRSDSYLSIELYINIRICRIHTKDSNQKNVFSIEWYTNMNSPYPQRRSDPNFVETTKTTKVPWTQPCIITHHPHHRAFVIYNGILKYYHHPCRRVSNKAWCCEHKNRSIIHFIPIVVHSWYTAKKAWCRKHNDCSIMNLSSRSSSSSSCDHSVVLSSALSSRV